MPSFDIVSEVNQVEIRNAVDQCNKEVANRFDFKGSDARVEINENVLTVFADDQFKLDQVRDVCSATLSVRKAHGRRVRQPLAHLVVASPDAQSLAPFVDIIADEVNVREVELTDDVDAVAKKQLQVVPSAIGPRWGRTRSRISTPG